MSAISRLWENTIFTDVAEVVDFVANGSFASLKENVIYLEHGYAVLVRLTDWKKKWNGKYVFVSKESYDFLKKSKLEPGDIIISCVGEPGQVFQVPDLGKPMTLGPNSVRLRENPNVLNKKYFFYFWKSSVGQKRIEEITSGSTQLKFNKTGLRATNIMIAPLNEQKRIADKLDKILARVDTCRERLDCIPTILKRFRQAVLAAATSGKLTEEWREKTGQTKSWQSVRLDEIAHIQGGVTKDSKKQSINDEEIPYLRVANVQRGYLDLNEVKTIRIPNTKLDKLLLEPGDILFNEGGDIDKLGRGWIWEGQLERCSFQNHVFRVRLFDKENQPKYISWWGNYRGLNYFLRSGKQTTNLASINKSMLSKLPIELPSTEEQTEIVRRVEEIFAYADRIEARYQIARAKVDKLTPATLAKAFRGELVPQDPDDEPVSVLLERIQVAGAENKVTPKQKCSRNKAVKTPTSHK